MNAWDDAGKALQAAAEIVHAITQLMNAKRGVESVAHAWPELRTQLEKTRADLKAAVKYGRTAPK